MRIPELPPTTSAFACAVADLDDPRHRLTRCTFSLFELLTMAFVAVVCGADYWEEIGIAVAAHEAWWVRTLDLAAGRVPSASTFKRVLPALAPATFIECFEAFARDVAAVAGAQVALDGKALRGSWTHGHTPLKLVHVWVVEHRVLFAQAIVDDGDELGGMKALIASLELVGALVTVDAGGASKPHARDRHGRRRLRDHDQGQPADAPRGDRAAVPRRVARPARCGARRDDDDRGAAQRSP